MAEHIIADVLIPGRGEPVEQGRVVLDGREIVYAGADMDGPVRGSDDTVTEAAVVMPGMWDCHAHFTGMPVPNLENLATSNVITHAARAVMDADDP